MTRWGTITWRELLHETRWLDEDDSTRVTRRGWQKGITHRFWERSHLSTDAQTNSTLKESRGLSRVNVAEENYSEWLQNCYYFQLINLFFNSTCVRLAVFGFQSLVDSCVKIGSFFSVQVGCVFDKLGALQSGILWWPSIKQQVFKSRKKIPFPKNQLVTALVF